MTAAPATATYAPLLCTEAECERYRHKKGLCHVHARAAGLYLPLPPCVTEGCTHKARTAAKGSRCRRCVAGLPVKRPIEGPEFCAIHKCPEVRKVGKWCRKHAARRNTPAACAFGGCARARFRARLCSMHARELANEIKECAYPRCHLRVWRKTFCGDHTRAGIDGLDAMSVDWFDWVAADRLYRGLPVGREPTPREVLEAVRKAELEELPYIELADRIGISPDRLEQWRYHSQRLVGAA